MALPTAARPRPVRRLLPLLVVALLGLAAGPRAGDPPPGTPSNVLVLLADDLGVDMVGAYGLGSDLPPTPNIDALAAGGVLFENAWADPYCSPTRATLMTGRYGFRTGIGVVLTPESQSLALSEVTLPEMLDAGTGGAWQHAAFGKWHLVNDAIDAEGGLPFDPGSGGKAHPLLQGWGTYAGCLQNLQCGLPVCNGKYWWGPFPYDYYDYPKVVDGREVITTTYATTDTVDDALGWIGGASEPWLCYVAFHAPHAPFQAPPAELNSSGLPPGEEAGPGDDKRPYYKAMVEAMDTEIGRLLADMDPGVLSRTTVVFLGDNGTQATVTVAPFDPSHAKGSVYEGGVHVPLIVSGPDVALPGSETRGLVNTTDLFATVADIAGVDPTSVLPPGRPLDSVSFRPYLADPSLPSVRDDLFAEHFSPVEIDPFCQKDLGLQGPGSASLTVCGQHLFTGNEATWSLTGAPPGASCFIVASQSFSPAPIFGGQIGPLPIDFLVGPFTADGAGEIVFPIPGASVPGSLSLYFQVFVQDPVQVKGWSLSNTVRVRFPDEDERHHVVAIRTLRYKLIRVLDDDAKSNAVYGPGLVDLLYDLRFDPFEATDLLSAGPLIPSAQAAYDTLSADLDALLGPSPAP